MPIVFLSPSTQEWNKYVNGGNEEQYMNILADRMEPYLLASGIDYDRNDPERNVNGAIADSNKRYYDVHLALHTNASPESLAGRLRGIDIYYSPYSFAGERLATITANNFKEIYPLPNRVSAVPTTSLGEITRTDAVAILAEIGYHDNVEDEAWLKGNLDAIAANLTQSLCDYFGIPFVYPTTVKNGIVSTDGSTLNLRAYPSVSGRLITSIPYQARVKIYGTVNGNWYVIRYNGYTGYVSADFVDVL